MEKTKYVTPALKPVITGSNCIICVSPEDYTPEGSVGNEGYGETEFPW